MEVKSGTLILDNGHDFNRVLCTAFGVCREDVPWNDTKVYINKLLNMGALGFRTLMNVAWGPAHQAEHGFCFSWNGSIYPLQSQDRSKLNTELFARIEKVLQYLKDRNGFLEFGLLDPSCAIVGLAPWYCTWDSGWQMLVDKIGELYAKYGNIIPETGNEPVKTNAFPRDQIKDFHVLLVDKLNQAGCNVVGVEISNGVGIPELAYDSNANVLFYKTVRTNSDYVIHQTWEELKTLQAKHKNHVIWGNEPPRKNYGGWSGDETHNDWLRWVAYMHVVTGTLFLHHGLSNNHEMPDNPKPFWGCMPSDFMNIIEPMNELMKKMHTPPAGPKARDKYYFGPDNSNIKNMVNGMAYGARRNRMYIIANRADQLTVTFNKKQRYHILNPVNGTFESPQVIPAGDHTFTNKKDRIFFFREFVDQVIEPA